MSLLKSRSTAFAALAIAMPAFAATPLAAQTIGIGATKAGAVAQITATISKVVSENAEGIQMRRQTFGGTQQYIPPVNAGELAFGISNLPQYDMAVKGTGLSDGTKYDNLRLVTNMMKFPLSYVVTRKSGIKTVQDLKGKRLGYSFKAAPLFQIISQSVLASGDMTFDDVQKVPAVGLVQHWDMMAEGKIDGVIAVVGTGYLKQVAAKLGDDLRHISIPDNPETLAKIHKHFPKTFIETFEPSKAYSSLVGPTNLITYDYVLWTHKDLSDDIAYKVAEVMHKNVDKLKEGGPLWNSTTADSNLCKDFGPDLPYHPGAVRYYKEAGLCK